MHQLRFLMLALITNLRLSLALKTAFFLSIFATILKQVLFLISWNFFFAKYQLVKGWDFNSMLAMYGTVCFSMGVVESFFFGFRDLPQMIENGQLDTFLLQPKNRILNIAVSKGDISSIGEIVTGILLMAYSGYLIKDFPMVLVVWFSGSVFMFSLMLYLGCIAFFIKDSNDFIRELKLNTIILSTQPNSAFGGFLKMLTFTILPVAFLSYFPVESLRTGRFEYLLATLLGTMIFFGVACWIFNRGVKRYESGNLMAFRQ